MLLLFTTLISVVTLSLSNFVSIEEDDGVAEVCAAMTDENCSAGFPFELHIRTAYDAAGIVFIIYLPRVLA